MSTFVCLYERVFPLKTPEDADAFLEHDELVAVFKASTSDKTLAAMQHLQKYLEPRTDAAIGVIRIPEDRPTSNYLKTHSAIEHQSPQFMLFRQSRPLFDLDKWKINPEHPEPLLLESLPVHSGKPLRNPAVVGLEAYLELLDRYIAGAPSVERFQWGYLDRLKKEAEWRSVPDFQLLNSLFASPDGRALTPWQGGCAGVSGQSCRTGRASFGAGQTF